ncbi:universal stress protein [Actinomycetes bacterium KLBMP 9759]
MVVGIDGSPSALQAVRWAAPEARRRGVPLRVVIAFTWGEDERHAGDPPHRLGHRDVLLAQARGHLAVAAQAVGRIDRDVAVERQLIVAPASEALAAEAERAQLLVLGSAGQSRLGGLIAGSVAVRVVANATCPVVVVRGRVPRDPELPVVVGVDGSEAAERALEFAFATADAWSAPLLAVHVRPASDRDPTTAHAVLRGSAEDPAEETLAEQVARWSDKYPDVGVASIVARGRIAHCLLARAKAAQLVVVGSRGRRPAAAAVLGSVSAALVHRSPCPVAVIGPAVGAVAPWQGCSPATPPARPACRTG